MLPYTKEAFEGYFKQEGRKEIISSAYWYEERQDYSEEQVGIERVCHKEIRGYEVLQGTGKFSGRLLGGCLESLYDILTSQRYEDQKAICERYGILPDLEEWKGKVLFIKTCEEKPTPELFEKELMTLKEKGIFDVISGILVGKPQDEMYYEEYKAIYDKVITNKELPILYNINFGHAHPKCILPYGALVEVDMDTKVIRFKEDWFN